MKKNNHWILPGGKKEVGEGDINCLRRELNEELPEMNITNINNNLLGNFTGITPTSKQKVAVKIYRVSATGNITTAHEITDARFIKNFEDYNLSQTTQNIVNFLKTQRYL